MKKKWIILIVVILLLAVVGGVFWWERNQGEEKGNEFILREFSSAEEWEIKDTPEGKFIEDKKAGLKVKVPEGWKIKVDKSERAQLLVIFFQKDTELGKNSIPKKGCWARLGVENNKKETERLSQEINSRLENTGSENNFRNMGSYKISREVIEVSNHKALKITFVFYKLNQGKSVDISIPVRNKVIYLRYFFDPGREEECAQAFDKFLEGVSIK